MKETRLETRLISQHSILPNDECQLLLVPLSFRVLLFDRHGRHMSPNCNNNRSNKDKISFFCFFGERKRRNRKRNSRRSSFSTRGQDANMNKRTADGAQTKENNNKMQREN